MAEAFDTGSPYSASPRGRPSDLSSSANHSSYNHHHHPPPAAEPAVFAPQFHFDEPTVEAIYPNFFILTWNPPYHFPSSNSASSSPSHGPTTSTSAPSSRQSSLAQGTTANGASSSSSAGTNNGGGGAASSSGPNRATWSYSVEWQGVLGIDVHRTDVSGLHAVIPIEFSHESVVVRVIAKGTVLVTLDATSRIFVTSKITVNTRKLSPMPWLEDGAASSPIIDESLVLASSVAVLQSSSTLIDAPLSLPLWDAQLLKSEDGVQQKPETPQLVARGSILQQSEYAAVKVEHSTPPKPVATKSVLFVVCHGVLYSETTTNAPGGAAAQQPPVLARSSSSNLSNSRSSPSKQQRPQTVIPTAMLQNALQEGSSIVFTGLGSERGTIASTACHRFIATLLDKNHQEPSTSSHVASLCRRVFCVTFNSPREEFYQADNAMILNGTAAYSGQFLHLFLSSALPARNSGFVEAVSKTVKPKKCANAMLGMRCGFSIDLSNRRWYLRVIASTSTDVRVDDLALCTMKDQSVLSRLLSATRNKISYADAVERAAPQVLDHDVRFGIGMEVQIQLRGISLAPHAHVTARTGVLQSTPLPVEDNASDSTTLSPPPSTVVACAVRHCEYTTVEATIDLVSLIPRAVWKHPPTAELDATTGLASSSFWHLSFSLTVSTTAGWVAVPRLQLRIPISLLEIIWPRLRQRNALWMYGKPNHVFATALSLEPLNASLYSNQGASFVPHATTKVLTALEFSSEMAAVNPLVPKKKSTSLLSMFAAKVQSVTTTNDPSSLSSHGGAGSAASHLLPQMLSSVAQPPTAPRASSGVFADSLAEHIEKRRSVTFFRGVMEPWRAKLLSSLPWLDDQAYGPKLKLLYCALVLRISPSRLDPWVTPTETAMEASLSTAVVTYLQQRTPNINWDEPLFRYKSFEQFYKEIFPFVQSASGILCSEGSSGGGSVSGSPTTNPNAAPKEMPSPSMMAFHDALALWVISLIHHLRRLHIFSKTILLFGPTGCGATGLLNELKLIRSKFERSVEEQSPSSSRASSPTLPSSDDEMVLSTSRRALAGKQTLFVVRRVARVEDILAVIPMGIDLLILGVVDLQSMKSADFQQSFRNIQKTIASSNRTVFVPAPNALSSTRSTMQDLASSSSAAGPLPATGLDNKTAVASSACAIASSPKRQLALCIVTKLDEYLSDFTPSRTEVNNKMVLREATQFVFHNYAQPLAAEALSSSPSETSSQQSTATMDASVVVPIPVALQASLSLLQSYNFVKNAAKHSNLTVAEISMRVQLLLKEIGSEDILGQLVEVACI